MDNFGDLADYSKIRDEIRDNVATSQVSNSCLQEWYEFSELVLDNNLMALVALLGLPTSLLNNCVRKLLYSNVQPILIVKLLVNCTAALNPLMEIIAETIRSITHTTGVSASERCAILRRCSCVLTAIAQRDREFAVQIRDALFSFKALPLLIYDISHNYSCDMLEFFDSLTILWINSVDLAHDWFLSGIYHDRFMELMRFIIFSLDKAIVSLGHLSYASATDNSTVTVENVFKELERSSRLMLVTFSFMCRSSHISNDSILEILGLYRCCGIKACEVLSQQQPQLLSPEGSSSQLSGLAAVDAVDEEQQQQQRPVAIAVRMMRVVFCTALGMFSERHCSSKATGCLLLSSSDDPLLQLLLLIYSIFNDDSNNMNHELSSQFHNHQSVKTLAYFVNIALCYLSQDAITLLCHTELFQSHSSTIGSIGSNEYVYATAISSFSAMDSGFLPSDKHKMAYNIMRTLAGKLLPLKFGSVHPNLVLFQLATEFISLKKQISSGQRSNAGDWLWCFTLSFACGPLMYYIVLADSVLNTTTTAATAVSLTPPCINNTKLRLNSPPTSEKRGYVVRTMLWVLDAVCVAADPHPWLLRCMHAWIAWSAHHPLWKVSCSKYKQMLCHIDHIDNSVFKRCQAEYDAFLRDAEVTIGMETGLNVQLSSKGFDPFVHSLFPDRSSWSLKRRCGILFAHGDVILSEANAVLPFLGDNVNDLRSIQRFFGSLSLSSIEGLFDISSPISVPHIVDGNDVDRSRCSCCCVLRPTGLAATLRAYVMVRHHIVALRVQGPLAAQTLQCPSTELPLMHAVRTAKLWARWVDAAAAAAACGRVVSLVVVPPLHDAPPQLTSAKDVRSGSVAALFVEAFSSCIKQVCPEYEQYVDELGPQFGTAAAEEVTTNRTTKSHLMMKSDFRLSTNMGSNGGCALPACYNRCAGTLNASMHQTLLNTLALLNPRSFSDFIMLTNSLSTSELNCFVVDILLPLSMSLFSTTIDHRRDNNQQRFADCKRRFGTFPFNFSTQIDSTSADTGTVSSPFWLDILYEMCSAQMLVLWKHIHSIHGSPSALELHTVNWFFKHSNDNISTSSTCSSDGSFRLPHISHYATLVMEPLMLLRLPMFVLSNSVALPVLLSMLKGLQGASAAMASRCIRLKRKAAIAMHEAVDNFDSADTTYRKSSSQNSSVAGMHLDSLDGKHIAFLDASGFGTDVTTTNVSTVQTFRAKSKWATACFLNPAVYTDIQMLMQVRVLMKLHEQLQYLSVAGASLEQQQQQQSHTVSACYHTTLLHIKCAIEDVLLVPRATSLVLLLVRQGLSEVSFYLLLSIPRLCDIVGNIIWSDCSQLELPEEFSYEGMLVDRCTRLLSYVLMYLDYPDCNSPLCARIASAIPSLLFRIYGCITVFHHVQLLADLEALRREITQLLYKRYPLTWKLLASMAVDIKRNANRSIGLQRLVESINGFECESVTLPKEFK